MGWNKPPVSSDHAHNCSIGIVRQEHHGQHAGE